jgi:hypothetical protein
MLASLGAAIILTSGLASATPQAKPAPAAGRDFVYRGNDVQLTLPPGWRITVPRREGPGASAEPNLMEATSGDGYRVSVQARCEHTEAAADFGWTLVPDASGFAVERIEERPGCVKSEAACLAEIKDGPEAEEERQSCRACAKNAGRLGILAFFPSDGQAIREVCLSFENDKRKTADREVLRRIAGSLRVLSPADVATDKAAKLGLEVPEGASAWRVIGPPDAKPTVTQVRSCLIYRSYAVLWTDDGYLGGVSAIEVRPRPDRALPAALCADDFSGQRLMEGDPEPITGGSPMGLLDRWLMLDSLTCNNVSCGFGVVDLRSGKKVLNASYLPGLGLSFARSGEGITATFWEPIIDQPCVPRRGEAKCWAEIRAKVGSPSFAKVPQPDCEEAVRRFAGDYPARAFVISTRVRRSLPGDAREYLPVQPRCDVLD